METDNETSKNTERNRRQRKNRKERFHRFFFNLSLENQVDELRMIDARNKLRNQRNDKDDDRRWNQYDHNHSKNATVRTTTPVRMTNVPTT